MNDLQRRLLVEQYHAPDRSVTGKQLAALAGLKSWSPVNSQYGRLGHMFCDATGHEPGGLHGGGNSWWAVWSLGYSTSKGFVWEMLPEVAEALERLAWVTTGEMQIPEEVLSEKWLVEGTTSRITINAHERNREARRKCIEHYGSSCAVCGLDLGSVYGSIAQGFVHVHHLKPLSEIGEEYEVDPITDLKPVCPNCHSIIHLGRQTRTIEEVGELLERARARPSP